MPAMPKDRAIVACRNIMERDHAVTVMQWSVTIAAPAELVFDTIADLRAYDDWLPRSSAFHGTTILTDGPVTVGTRYVEPGPFGTRHGIVTRCSRPKRLDFEQPMTMRPALLGVIGITLTHEIEPAGPDTRLRRRLDLAPNGPARWFAPLLDRAFRAENERMLPILKQACEARASAV